MRRLQRLPEAVNGGYTPQVKTAESDLIRQNKQKQTERQAGSKACLRYICGEECLQTKELWQEVFSEDSRLFTDYYFRVKAPENEGFVLEGEEGLRAMLFLTPEKMRVFEETVQLAYIVGVATKACWRHRGYMARLLSDSFSMLYERKMPFVFLMPASAAIYEPFAFRFIYDRPVWDVQSLHMDELKVLGQDAVGKMAAFSQMVLEKTAAVYIRRDAAYDKVLLEEVAAQEGCVLGFFEPVDGMQPGDDCGTGSDFAPGDGFEQLSGICLYTCEEGEADILEVLAMPGTESRIAARCSETKPCIMARILHLPSMLVLLRAADPEEAISFWLHVTDEQIEENNGSYFCQADEKGCRVRKMTAGAQVDAEGALAVQTLAESGEILSWSGSIAQLVQRIFGYEIPGGQQEEIWKHLRLLCPVWINEIV